MVEREPEPSAAQSDGMRYTIVAMFDDTIDAERTLVALRATGLDADRVSLLVRDTHADQDEGAARAGVVARAIVDTALGAVAGWLHGFVSLILPERGTYLVAGPLGAALAGVGGVDAASFVAGSPPPSTPETPSGLLRTLTEFGFGSEEAAYLDSRLAAGATVIAVTADDQETLTRTKRLFADYDAVHLGVAASDPRVVELAEALLAAPPEQLSGDVVVTDAVASLRWVSGEDEAAPLAGLRRRQVIDQAGEVAGTVEDVIIEVLDPDGPSGPLSARDIPRYLVVAFGGLLGIGRQLVALPISLANVATDPARVEVDREVLHHAPTIDDDTPLSRREERAIAAYFGVEPYWLSE